ncbi:MAG: hypothetical protein HY391_00095 [Deltaproteobacteria bacterium]|nr:hypothetical protein [Deltaproteobacteria bacterium]
MKIDLLDHPIEQAECDIVLFPLGKNEPAPGMLPEELKAIDWRLNGSITKWMERFQGIFPVHQGILIPTGGFALSRYVALFRAGEGRSMESVLDGIEWERLAIQFRSDVNFPTILKWLLSYMNSNVKRDGKVIQIFGLPDTEKKRLKIPR